MPARLSALGFSAVTGAAGADLVARITPEKGERGY